TDEANNPMRVPNTLVVENNFCNINISGDRGKRVLTMQCFDKNGALKWEHKLSEEELKAKR
ncbi:MAG: hypothetical protein KBE91_07800, partial [Bacteroidia bacterium]|nr:hypothetical protein [Bacteroidia bacterium]